MYVWRHQPTITCRWDQSRVLASPAAWCSRYHQVVIYADADLTTILVYRETPFDFVIQWFQFDEKQNLRQVSITLPSNSTEINTFERFSNVLLTSKLHFEIKYIFKCVFYYVQTSSKYTTNPFRSKRYFHSVLNFIFLHRK